MDNWRDNYRVDIALARAEHEPFFVGWADDDSLWEQARMDGELMVAAALREAYNRGLNQAMWAGFS